MLKKGKSYLIKVVSENTSFQDLLAGVERYLKNSSFGKSQNSIYKMKLDDLQRRTNQLIEMADAVSATRKERPTRRAGTNILPGSIWVDSELYHEFRTASLSFIGRLFGEENVYYKEFTSRMDTNSPGAVSRGRGILKAIKQEIEGGWLTSVRGLVSAEIFTDFLEMAGHLLREGYKDAAAVMIGGVLEEHLRHLCTTNNISPFNIKDGKETPKKADAMNNELYSAGVYGNLEQKNVVAWLDLRNKAAHGLYNEFRKEQVEFMEISVSDFIARSAQ